MAGQQIVAKKPWNPVQGETASAYAGFCMYRELGASRSIADVLRGFDAMGEKVSKETVYGWSNKFDWDDRVLRWEQNLQNLKAETERKEAQRTAVRLQQEKAKRIEVNLYMADKLRMKVLDLIDYPTTECTKTEVSQDGKTIHKTYEPVKWSMRDITIMARVAMELERLSLFANDKDKLDTSNETLAQAADRLTSWRADMTAQIEGFPESPPGSISNPIESTSSE